MLAIIPARGGSKGIPRKNLVKLADKPLIDYTIRAALGALSIDQVVVSSDDDEILRHCKNQGIKWLHNRPKIFSQDGSLMRDALLSALDWFKYNTQKNPETIIVLQPTSPMRDAMDIKSAINEYESKKLNALVSVSPVSEHPCECLEILNDRSVRYLVPPPAIFHGRQDYTGAYFFINGAIYMLNVADLLLRNSLIPNDKFSVYRMSKSHSVDIDTVEDLRYAEFLMKNT